MRLIIPKVFLAFCTIEGLIAIGLFLAFPSESKSVVLFNYSARKLAIGTILVVVEMFFVFTFIRAITDDCWLQKRIVAIRSYLEAGDNLFYFSFITLSGIIGLFGLLIIGKVTTGGTIFIAVHRTWYPLIWFTAILLQIAILVGVFYWRVFITTGWFYKLTIIVSLLIISVFQWVVLICNLDVYKKIYNWGWRFPPIKQFHARDALILVIISGSIFLAWYLLQKPIAKWKSLILLMAWGILLQLSFGVIDGPLPKSILHKYSDTPGIVYSQEAARNPNILNIISHYEDYYSTASWWTGTKPPGFMLMYVGVEKMANLLSPSPFAAMRLVVLLQFIFLLFLIFSVLVTIPLYTLACRIGGEQVALITCLFYFTFPSFLLMPLYLDQVLFPFLFVSCLLIILVALEKMSLLMGFLSGCVLFLVNFISFSLLPVFIMAFFMVGLHYLFLRKEMDDREKHGYVIFNYLKIGISVFFGVITLLMLFKIVLNYDVIVRYYHAIQVHYQLKGAISYNFSAQSLSFLPNFLLGANADFTFWTGYTPIILSLIALGVSLKNITRNKVDRMDWLVMSFWGTFILLNLSGQTSNETGRLWLFLIPLLALFSAGQAARLFPQQKFGVYLYIFLQLVTSYLIFHFSDFGP
jgi:hypothetical protein